MGDVELKLLIDLHRHNLRQGPGGNIQTLKALALAGLDKAGHLEIADIGCGTGAASILLASELDAEIIAVDFLPEFLEELEQRARVDNVADKIKVLNCSMDALPFVDNQFDIIWSEGAIYNMGFDAGLAYWHRYLKPGGKIIVSEITWLRGGRPAELQKHWDAEYPELGTAADNIAILEKNGYVPEAYFYLPRECWLDNYYRPMQAVFDDFIERNNCSEQARAIVECEKHEIGLYEKYFDYYSYGFYIAKKV